MARTPQALWDDALAGFPTDRKIELAKELERLTLAADPRVRIDDANYADAWGEVAVATTTGIRESGRENGCYVSVSSLADDGDETQTGFGFSVGRQPDDLDLAKAARRRRRPGHPPARRDQAAEPAPDDRARPVRDGAVPRRHLVDAQRRERRQGAQPVPRPPRRAGRRRASSRSSTTRPTRWPTPPPTSTARASPPAATCSSSGGTLRQFVHNSYSARRAGTVSTGNAIRGGFAGTPGVGCLALPLQPGTRAQAELVAAVDDGLLVQTVVGLHSGVNPISGDFSTGASGMLISGGAVGAPVRELTIASTLQRMLLDIVEVGGDVDWLPMRAAGVSLVIRDVMMSGRLNAIGALAAIG